ncbi:MAG: LytTR family DNA-binding domain-containing protein [Marinifilaceae bacterium]|jgi:DNA-binding LytR/AlgR family response regulator|nr:response regulator transcription factor [Marinilabiliaceae bacterium JC040]MCT4599355.1 LytTR family DNA-binding domain-containing protein [Marinifilaceae bacterium]
MNCIIVDDDKLARDVLEKFISRVDFLNLVGSYEDAIEASNALKKKDNGVDLIFLDVEMPEMTGIEFLSTMNDAPQIIIVSSKEQYALDSYEYAVTDYLLKPVHYTRFLKAVNKAYDKVYEQPVTQIGDSEIFVKSNSALVRLEYDDILWIEALENYIMIRTFDNKFIIHFTMKSMESKLSFGQFVRVHRSYIVNRNKIEVIEDSSVVVRTELGVKSIPIGKSYREKLLKDLNIITK